jgi:hypothetical protein
MLPTKDAMEEKAVTRASAAEEAELEALQRSLRQKQGMLDVLRETSERLGYSDLGPELKRLAELKDREAELRELADLRQTERKEAERKVSEAEVQVKQLQELLQRLRMAFLKVQKDDRELADVRSTKLPRLKKVQKDNYFVVLHRQRVYLIRRPGAYTLELAHNDQDFDVTRMWSGWVFKPLATKGVPAKEWLTSPTGARKVLSQVDKASYIIHLVLYPDSLPCFTSVRNAFTGEGYDYNWSPVSAGEPIVIVPATGPMDAQTPN